MSTLGFILLSRYGQQVNVFGIIIGIATLNGLLLGIRWALDTLGAPLYGAVIDRAGIQRGAPACFVTGACVMVLLANSTGLAGLAIGIVVFFMCGTATELVPVSTVDGMKVGSGSRGPITKALQDAFFGIFDGTTETPDSWLDPVA